MFAIDEGSEAFTVLQAIFAKPDTTKVTIAYDSNDQLMVKRNESMWTHPMQVRKIR